MSGYRTGEERDAVLQRMVDAGVTPNDVSWSTLVQGFSKDRLPMHCLVCFCRMLQAKVPPDTFTFNFLFTCLVSDCRDEHCLRTVVHIASLRIVSRLMVNHFVATPALSALASVGVNNDILSFWQFCGRHLSRSKEGWPGQETHEILSRRCRKNRGSGWALLLALLEGRRSAEGAPVWPPKDAPPSTDMMKEAVLRAAQYRAPTPSIVIGGSAAVGKNGHASRSSSPPAPAAAAAACKQGAAASISSRSMTCRDCRYAHLSNTPLLR
jgi:pentatricopeptide repeat protein